MNNKLSRRGFLRAASLASAAVVLTACSQNFVVTPLISSAGNAGAGPTVTPDAASTGPVAPLPPASDSDKIGIQLMVRGGRGIISQAVVDTWNANSKAQVTLVSGSSGTLSNSDFSTLMQTNIASGDQPWDGYATISSPYDMLDFVSKEVILPMDDLIKQSSTPGSGLVLSSILPSILPAVKYQDKVYGLPVSTNSTAFIYYPQTLKDAGYDGVPQTYDDVHKVGLLVKKKFPRMTVFVSSSSPLTDLWAWLWGASKKPLDADGLIDIRSEDAINALTWLRQMGDDTLTYNPQPGSSPGYGGGGYFRRAAAMMVGQDSLGLNVPAADPNDPTQPQGNPALLYNVVPKAGAPNAGAPFWVNLVTLLNQGKNPQGTMNFYMWLFGPNNTALGQQIAQNSPKPCYTYTYDAFVKTNKALAWEQDGVDLTAKSVWFPFNSSHTFEQNIVRTHIQNVMYLQKQFSPELAQSEMQAAYSEIRAALSKG